MSGAQELVLRQRAELLSALCRSGSAEPLERVLDVLIARGALLWEDYLNVQVPGRALCANARHLLDIVHTKGVDACALFLAALNQVLSPEEVDIAGLSLGKLDASPDAEDAGVEHHPTTATETLVTARPALIRDLKGCVEGALAALLEAGSLTQTDCDEVQLPVYTPSQKVRLFSLPYMNLTVTLTV